MSSMSDPRNRHDFFLPGEIVLLIEHDSVPPQDFLKEAIESGWLPDSATLKKLPITFPAVQRNDTAAVKPPPEAIQALQRDKPAVANPPEASSAILRSATRGGRIPNDRPFSLVFVDMKAGNERLIEHIETHNFKILATREGFINSKNNTLRLRAVSPNWLSNGTPSSDGTGGPGAMPVPGKDPNFQMSQLSGTSTVEVAILDTAPSVKILQAKAADARNSNAGPGHSLLPSLESQIHTVTDLDHDELAKIGDPDANKGWRICGHDYKMTDHGLFVAGIIHQKAPEAKIHLIRVLSDYGVGSLDSITHGLQMVYEGLVKDLSAGNAHPLIVNMSLMLTIPSLADFRCEWIKWPRLHENRVEQAKRDEALLDAHQRKQSVDTKQDLDLLDLLVSSVHEVCVRLLALGGANVEIIAAAGNDGRTGHPAPRACYPAAFEVVRGVGALNRDNTRAHYSCLADTPDWTGVWTFGGDSSLADPGCDACSVGYADDSSVLGVYLGEFPADPTGARPPNDHGWAYWAGTSFAAPAISGAIAAHCIANHSDARQAYLALWTNSHVSGPHHDDHCVI